MNIEAQHLGYRELGKIAEFIEVISEGNPLFEELVEDGSIIIGYDLHYDSVSITTKCGILYFPDDFE